MNDRELLIAIYKLQKRTHQHVRFQNIMTGIKILAIVLPLIFALLYLPRLVREISPELEKMQNTYKQSTDLMNTLNSLQ